MNSLNGADTRNSLDSSVLEQSGSLSPRRLHQNKILIAKH